MGKIGDFFSNALKSFNPFSAIKEFDEKKKSESTEPAKKIAEPRQAYLDSAVGFKSSSEVSKVFYL